MIWTWLAESVGMTTVVFFVLALIFIVRDQIGAATGPMAVHAGSVSGTSLMEPLGRSIDCRTDIATARNRLGKWLAQTGCEIPTYEWYAFRTVPAEKQVGVVDAYRVWRPDAGDRWNFHIGPVEQRSAFYYIELLSSDKPSETIITLTAGMIKRGTPLYRRTQADIDSLSQVLADVSEPGKPRS